MGSRQGPGAGPLTGGSGWDYFVHVGDRTWRVRIHEGGVEVDGVPLEIDLAPGSKAPLRSARINGRSLRVLPRRNGRGEWLLEVEGARVRAEVLDRAEEAIRNARRTADVDTGPAPLRAPMPGLVVKVEVEPGDEVAAGEGLLIVEAMKMENELRSDSAARVARVLVAEGDAVEKDQVLIEFEPLEESRGGGASK